MRHPTESSEALPSRLISCFKGVSTETLSLGAMVMLQINTGKLFTRDVGRANQLRGVLYSNGWILPDNDIVTAAGTLRAAGSGPNDSTIVYELLENIEKEKEGPGVLISHTVKPYLDDMAAVASFYLGVLVSPDHDFVQRMINGNSHLSTHDQPRTFVQRFFDKQVSLLPEDGSAFSEFIDQLLGLERKHFLGAMRAIRTYVAALHSLSSDLGLSYTLLVSAAETLSQKFDGYESEWSDVDDQKRHSIDQALEGVPEARATAVREAMVQSDHVALSRRYREFVLASVGPEYFRGNEPKPISRWELPTALKQAYTFRSKYIHSAQPPPDPLKMPMKDWETTEVGRHPVLTFQGLSRLTRHVIIHFVENGPKIKREVYDYSLERAGIIQAQLAAQYWIAKPIAKAEHFKQRLEGFLDQLATSYLSNPRAPLTDLRPIMGSLREFFPQAHNSCRPSIYALYLLFNALAGSEFAAEDWQSFCDEHCSLFDQPTGETLITRTILENDLWDLSLHEQAHENYWNQRLSRSGFHAPKFFEAAASLMLAERFRQNGDLANVQLYVSSAVECFPECKSLITFEAASDFSDKIFWRKVLGVEPE